MVRTLTKFLNFYGTRRPASLILLYLIILTIFDEEYKLWRLCVEINATSCSDILICLMRRSGWICHAVRRWAVATSVVSVVILLPDRALFRSNIARATFDSLRTPRPGLKVNCSSPTPVCHNTSHPLVKTEKSLAGCKLLLNVGRIVRIFF